MTQGPRPVLWQLQISHYNEKARWALDYKCVPHVRRSLLPGIHALVAHRLTGGETDKTPLLTLDGRSIGSNPSSAATTSRATRSPSRT